MALCANPIPVVNDQFTRGFTIDNENTGDLLKFTSEVMPQLIVNPVREATSTVRSEYIWNEVSITSQRPPGHHN